MPQQMRHFFMYQGLIVYFDNNNLISSLDSKFVLT